MHSPRRLIAIGFLLVFAGFIFPFLMVMQLVEPTLFLSFVSHGASVTGLFLGLIGAAGYARGRN